MCEGLTTRQLCFYVREKPTQVLLVQADELEEVGGAYEGSIAVAVGLKHVSDLLMSLSTDG